MDPYADFDAVLHTFRHADRDAVFYTLVNPDVNACHHPHTAGGSSTMVGDAVAPSPRPLYFQVAAESAWDGWK